MELNEYQEKAMTTCMGSSNNFSYMFLNLVGEVGEFASKVAKHIRKEEAIISGNNIYDCENGNIDTDALKYEAGDVLWQLSGLCHSLGWKLEDIAQMNIEKLQSRKKRNVIDGNGDNR